MKLFFKEDPDEWRKSVLLTALGLALLSSLLRWRKYLSENHWCVLLIMFAVVALCAILRPRWFRGWYRFSLRLGFYSGQMIGHCVLALFFIFIITPLGFAMRLTGKDTLQLKHPPDAKTYWHQARDSNPLDRLF
jgi:Saxitoxin biosynthesis operon protein SxtJ